MAGATSVEAEFGDGSRLFHLDLPRLRELQDRCGAGPAEIFRRLAEGRARIEDVRETIRLGLIGGGAAPPEALRLVETYVDARPLVEGIAYATLILGAAVIGRQPEQTSENPPKAKPRTAGSTSPKSRRRR